jgi:hypothetical protein
VNNVWRRLWHIEAAERVRAFIWLLKHNRLMTNSPKHRMGIGSADCWWCHGTEETTLHVLRDCPYAMALWMNTVSNNKRDWFFTVDFESWIDINITDAGEALNVDSWTSFWATSCYYLWVWRNKALHD